MIGVVVKSEPWDPVDPTVTSSFLAIGLNTRTNLRAQKGIINITEKYKRNQIDRIYHIRLGM